MEPAVIQLKEMVASSDNIVFFGGAGVSTESGIPDFRSVDGLYHQKFRYPPETILSHTFMSATRRSFLISIDRSSLLRRPGPMPPM